MARKIVAVFALAPACAAMIIDAPVPSMTRALIALLWVLSLVPFYIYFGTPPLKRRPLPFLPAVSAMYGLYYALPLTLGVTDQYFNAPVDPRADYDFPVQLAFFGWIAMVAGYQLVSIFVTERRPTREVTWNPSYLAQWGLALLVGGICVNVMKAALGHGMTSGGIYQFIVSLQWLGAGLLVVLARRKELTVAMKVAALSGIILTTGMMLAGGSIAPVAMFFGIIGFAVWIGKPSIQVRWVLIATILAVVATSFRGVAIDFRKTAWFGAEKLTQSERLGLMVNLLQSRIDQEGVLGTIGDGIGATAGRSAELDLLANVVRRTPSEIPYWNGQTYLSLAGAFVPRFLWKDKPTKELGQAFGHRYSFIYWTNTSTAINLPVLVEFFVNFSTLGVIVGMLIVGIIYRLLDAVVNRRSQSPLLSMIGGVLLLPLLLIESDFSLVFGGVPLNAVALWIMWTILSSQPRTSRAPSATAFRNPGFNRRLLSQ